jgi:cell division septum initiation protein DivIVA
MSSRTQVMFSSMFLDDLIRPRVFVISDSEYQKHQQAEAQRQIDVLESRADTYRKYLATVESSIEELKKNAGLLPAADKV